MTAAGARSRWVQTLSMVLAMEKARRSGGEQEQRQRPIQGSFAALRMTAYGGGAGAGGGGGRVRSLCSGWKNGNGNGNGNGKGNGNGNRNRNYRYGDPSLRSG